MVQPESSDGTLRRRLLLSLVVSLLIIGVGMAWTWQVGKEANKIDHGLSHAQEDLEALQKYVQKSKGKTP